jgi:hypothetical protein
MKSETQPSPIIIFRLTWAALLMSSLIYGVVLYITVLQNQAAETIPMDGQNLDFIYLVFPIIPLALSFTLPKLIFRKSGIAPLSKLETHVQEFNKNQNHYKVPYILKLVLLESGTLVGFAFSFATQRFEYFALGCFLSVACFLLNLPTEEKIVASFRG